MSFQNFIIQHKNEAQELKEEMVKEKWSELFQNLIIQLTEKGYDNLSKESHPGKSLEVHIKEIKKISSEILKFHQFPLQNFKICEYLAETHDLGKLSQKWNIDEAKRKDPNFSHSIESVKIIWRFEYFIKNLEWILSFFIYRHHGALKKGEINDIPYKDQKISLPFDGDSDFGEYLDSLDFEKRITLVDSFGVFKIADSISADSKNNEEINNKIKNITNKAAISVDLIKSSFKNLDFERWGKQLKISQLGDRAILQAPTGWGKTNVSLLFAVNKDFSRIFYILPTITAIRRFKNRLEEILGKEHVDSYFYFYEVEARSEEKIDLEALFYAQYFLKPIIITTIDQFLMTFLQVGKYHLKRFNFRNSILILDEIHLLSPAMLKYFLFLFNKFKDIYNLKLLLMSATLPKEFIKFLREELNIDKRDCLSFIDELKYKNRVMFKYHPDEDLSSSTNLKNIVSLYRKGKKVLVIVNTVEKAINIGRKLIEDFKIVKSDVVIFHSRFIYKDRLKKEEELVTKNSSPHILVCTQVAEVSLDISYDYLFTELAQISSLVQRFGRVNRYGDKTNQTNVWIFYPQEVDKKRRYPYSKEELDVSDKILRQLEKKGYKSEFEIYRALNDSFSLESLKERMDKEDGIIIESWEKIKKYFFSLSFTEEEIQQILNYREGVNVLVVLSPEIIEEEIMRNEVEQIIRDLDKPKTTYNERKEFLSKLKELTIPVPVWLVREKIEGKFPVVIFKNYGYNYQYGLYPLEDKDFVI